MWHEFYCNIVDLIGVVFGHSCKRLLKNGNYSATLAGATSGLGNAATNGTIFAATGGENFLLMTSLNRSS